MRRLLILSLLLLPLAPLHAQHYVGARAGYGYGSVRFFPPQETTPLWGLYSGGLSWKYYSKERLLGGIEVDMLYLQRGWRRPYENSYTYIRQVNSLQIPFFWQPHIYLGARRIRLFLNAGVTLSYNLSSTESTIQPPGSIVDDQHNDYEFIDVRDNRWGYGLVGGFGVNYIVGRLELLAEVRYDFGYGDILKNATKYPDNLYRRSPLDDAYIHIGAYWRLGKGGFLSPTSPKVAAKIAARDAARAARVAQRNATAAPPSE